MIYLYNRALLSYLKLLKKFAEKKMELEKNPPLGGVSKTQKY